MSVTLCKIAATVTAATSGPITRLAFSQASRLIPIIPRTNAAVAIRSCQCRTSCFEYGRISGHAFRTSPSGIEGNSSFSDVCSVDVDSVETPSPLPLFFLGKVQIHKSLYLNSESDAQLHRHCRPYCLFPSINSGPFSTGQTVRSLDFAMRQSKDFGAFFYGWLATPPQRLPRDLTRGSRDNREPTLGCLALRMKHPL